MRSRLDDARNVTIERTVAIIKAHLTLFNNTISETQRCNTTLEKALKQIRPRLRRYLRSFAPAVWAERRLTGNGSGVMIEFLYSSCGFHLAMVLPPVTSRLRPGGRWGLRAKVLERCRREFRRHRVLSQLDTKLLWRC